MRFPPSFLDELRARLPVSEVVGRRVKLKKAGREWKGLSPFNKEKTPSFFVNDQKAAWFDFSSGKNGNIFDFLMQTEGVTFPEAVERLASMAGVPLPNVSPEADAREQRRKTLHDVVELAAKFFEKTLGSREGAKARGYLSDRGVKPATQVEFRIGYAPAERYALKEYLGLHGVPVDDMIEAGLLIAGEDIPVPYDRFRDRVIIPIHDQRGRVVAFGGRVLNPDVQPKYLNSPETPLFHKGSVVFNFHRAREPAHKDGSVVVVEGYLDAISIYQAGMKSVVASMGTAFTEEQVQTLWKLSTEPIVCFDADKAGISAAHRSIDRILPILTVGKTFRFAFIQSGKDPDELIRDKGLEAFKEVLSGSLPLWDVLWERELGNAKLDSPDGRAVFEHRLYSIIRMITDPTVHTAYRNTCRVDLSELFWTTTKKAKGKSVNSELVNRDLKIDKDGYRHNVQKVLLGTLVHYPELIDKKEGPITQIVFAEKFEAFIRSLYALLVDYERLDVALIYERLSPHYYEVLQDIHGDKSEKRKRGWRLVQRFPIIDAAPPLDFVEECVDHLIHILQVEQMNDEIQKLKVERFSEDEADEFTERLVNLKRHFLHEREVAENWGTRLTEWAEKLRKPLREVGGGMAASGPVLMPAH